MTALREAAIPPSPASRADTDWVSIAILWFAGIAAAMQFAKFSVAFESLQAQYRADSTQMGFALSVVGVTGLIFGVSAGVLAGRIGHRRVLLAALTLGAALSLVQAASPPVPILILSRLIEGVSHLGIVVAAPTMIMLASAHRHQSMAMAIWGTFFGVAFALMGWLGPMILDASGIPALFGGHAALMILLTLGILRSPQPGGAAGASAPSPEALSVKSFLRENLLVYTSARTMFPGVIFLFHTCMFIALLTFVPRLTSDHTTTALLLIGLPLVSIGGTFLAGAISQYALKPQTLVIVAFASVACLSVAASMVVHLPGVFALTAMALLLASGIIQGASFAAIPHLTRAASDQARANGAVAQLGNLGATVGPPAFAMAIGSGGAAGMVWLVLLLCIGGAVSGALARRL